MLGGILFPAMANANAVWEQKHGAVPHKGRQMLTPKVMAAYELNDAYLKNYLFSLTDNANAGHQIELPNPDGGFRTFVIWKSHLMAEGLASKYEGISTFTAYALDNPRVIAKLDYTLKGFHAMVYDGANTYFIDPYSNVNDGFYMSYYKRDYIKPLNERMICEFDDAQAEEEAITAMVTEEEQMQIGATSEPALPQLNYKVLNGIDHRTYRLALACTYEYSVAVDGPTPTVAGVLSAMVTSVNRVVGVYELEMAITLELVANTDDLIWITSGDPYNNNNGSSMLNVNHTQCNNIIGAANYDLGHVFSTGGGGIANLGAICSSTNKGKGVTGSANPVGDPFDIDYVAHEMGHQFGGSHTFNSTSGSCSGNRSSSSAYEPGSGTTIMAYAGICPTDNMQSNSDAYFHARSLQQIYNEINKTSKQACPSKVNTGNPPPGIPSFSASYSIPFLTPFELQAPQAIDSGAVDTLTTYCWEEWDLGPASSWPAASTTGPIFRSFLPKEDRWRVFPDLGKLVLNITNYIGEKLPPDARTLTFKLSARSIYDGLGSAHFSDDSIRLNVINTTTPFAVTAPNTVVQWAGGSTQTITWDVSGTTAAPISCANVNIYLSTDGGFTYPYMVAANVANNGSATATIPNVPTTTTARMKVKGAGNVFFDISNVNFKIDNNPNLPPAVPNSVQQVAVKNPSIKVFPVPAQDVLNISSDEAMSVSIYNVVGQSVYTGNLQSGLQVNVKDWAKGVYYIHFVSESGKRYSKTVAVQ